MSRKRKDLQRNYTALTVVFLLLIVIGAVNVFSTTFVADRVAGNMFSHLIRQIAYICFGAIPAIVLFRQDYHWLDKHDAAYRMPTSLASSDGWNVTGP